VLSALAGTAVPVPRVFLLCDDDAVIGQMFYLMEYIEGRVFVDRLLPDCEPAERAALYDAMNATLAELHKLDVAKLGLSDFGRPTGFVARQVSRWGKQWEASKTEDVPDMDRVIAWLAAHVPDGDEIAISHGDFRMGNLLIHPTEPRVVAVLDWELATIGHPLADLAYASMAYQLPYADGRGFGVTERELVALGIPSEADFVAAYCRRVGRALPRDWRFFMAFSLFRGAAILAGVYRRGLDGNAADARGVSVGGLYKIFAERAWAVAQDGATLPR
jgi:aminoglycoside phosphotransferase (APT) family kinase protein